ncbi:GAF and ANTAR domain-containing protein [Haloechinothrix halophila]|uniref:GAF and ANTAR domain-containing protein n=1 Tax=Haloechinothrix halophila TaxID=1069073 RepID=UPI0004163C77|nr:GAF and ANTAR domain-containing protein [Haloechinothrix halophila]
MNDPALSGVPRELRLLQAFVDAADTLVDDYDVTEMLHQLAVRCVELLDAGAAGFMLSDQRGSLQVLASSDERTQLLELFQLQADEGPCLDSFRTGQPVLVSDLSESEQRWPQFVPEAMRENYRAVHALPMRLRQQTIGALNLFGHQPGPINEQDLLVAGALADVATIGILQERAIHRGEVVTEQLQDALNNRITIEQAKGLLSHAHGVDMNQAWEQLRTYSRGNRTRVSDVAYRLVTGELPPVALLPGRGAGPEHAKLS